MTKRTFRGCLIVAIAAFYLVVFFKLDRWSTTLYYGDSSHYYLHVVSWFINKDVGDYDKTISSLLQTNADSQDPREDVYGIRLTDNGRRYIKYTVGVPLFETPFFLIAHSYALLSTKYEANGWSRPYLLLIGLAPIFYICLGFWLISGILLRYFSRNVTALSMLTVAMATNLLYQGTYVVMSHAFLFFAHCLLIYLTVRFYDSPGKRRALSIGLVVGLITLTRVPEIICVVVPLLWGVYNKGALDKRMQFLMVNPSLILVSALGTLVVFSLQITYWYYVSGELFFDPYQGEGIDLLNPKLHKGWFAYSNGWLIYTPIMVFSLVGLMFMRGKSKETLVPILAFVIPHAYIHYSYYAWTYFPGLGQRPMVETYPLLIFGLGAFFVMCAKSRWTSWAPIVLIVSFTALNVFQTWQSNEGIIWTERGNRAFYWATFGKTSSSLKSFRAYDTSANQPNEEDVEYVTTLFFDDFESLEGQERSGHAFSGTASLLSKSYDSEWYEEFNLTQVEGRDWLRISIMAYFAPEQIPDHRDHCTQFVIELYDANGQRRRYRSMAITSHLGNQEGSIWTKGEPGIWDEAMFYFRLPGDLRGWKLKAFLRNTHGQEVNVDDVRIDRYRVR